MIISKTPYRLPISGGGTDIDFYYRKSKGHLISVAINQYVYVLIMPRLIDKNYLIQTTSTQFTNRLDRIQHILIRETLKYYKIKEKMHVGTYSTVPTRTGLGTSSAMVIGLINCINKYKNLGLTDLQIVKDAYTIERIICKVHGGWQDQVVSQFGGFLDIKIYKDEKIKLKKLKIEKNIENIIKKNFLLVYTEIKRNSSKIILSQKKNKASIIKYYDKIKSFNNLMLESFKGNRIRDIGLIFDEHWKLKKSLSDKISDKKINKFYENLMCNFNIIGGKLIGAGGGGFFLVCTTNKKKLMQKLSNNKINFIDFKIERLGSIIVENQ